MPPALLAEILEARQFKRIYNGLKAARKAKDESEQQRLYDTPLGDLMFAFEAGEFE